MSNRYRVKRTCHTKPIVTDCLLPCGPGVWESLTTASTRLSLRHLRARNQVSVQVVACFVPTVIFAILIHFYEFQSFVFLMSSLTSLPTLHLLVVYVQGSIGTAMTSCCSCASVQPRVSVLWTWSWSQAWLTTRQVQCWNTGTATSLTVVLPFA